MSWLLFLDESGHDHRTMPYEIHGGFAIHASKLWPFISAVQTLEQSMFGAFLHEFDTELKGSKLLAKDRFKWNSQGPLMDASARRKHALNFLNSSRQKRNPRQEEFTAFGQSCILMADGILQLLKNHGAVLFATIIPRQPAPTKNLEYLRKDLVFLFERYFYFLESRREMGLIVMDGSEKQSDRKLARRMERYFTQTQTGRQRTQWIVPAPLFVESDMTYGVQAADLCIYCLNWGYRLQNMSEKTRVEIEPFVTLMEKMIWHGDGYRSNKVFPSHGVVYVPDPFTPRSAQ